MTQTRRSSMARRLTFAAIGSLGLAVGLLGGARPGSAAPADTVTEIHYSFGDTPDSVWFDWDGQEQDIYYGPDTSYGQLAVAGNSPITPVDSPGPFRQVQLTGLQPSSTYHYKIGADGVDHTFQTIPEGDFTWVDLGDTGSTLCDPWVAQTHQLVAAQDPAFVTHGGDISYANECGVAAVHQYYVDQQVWSDGAAFEPVWGNHEYGAPNSDEGDAPPPPGTPRDSLLNYKGRSFITNGQAVPLDSATRTTNPGCGWETGSTVNTCQGSDWGWFQTGHVLFISYPEPWPNVYPAWQAAAGQLMASAQANPAIDFIVTYGHRPDYSSVTSGVDPNLQTAIDNLALQYSPSASNPQGKYVLNVDHHIHWEEVFKPIDGLVNVTNGGGGAGQASATTFDPNSIFHMQHLGILAAHYSAAQHSLTFSLLCGPAFTPNPKTTCTYGSVLYSQTFVSAAAGPPPAQLTTMLTDNNPAPQVGQQITYTVSVGDPVTGSTAQGVSASLALPANESIVSAGGGTVSGQSVSWNLGNLAGGQPVTEQVTATLASGSPGQQVTAAAAISASDSSCQASNSVCAAADTVVIAAPPAGHQWITNQSVESSMTGWTGTYGPSPDVTITRSNSAAHSGSFSLKVTGLTGAQNLSSGFNDNPRWVLKTVKGTTYSQSAWVDPTFVGQKITLRLREWNGSTLVTDHFVTLTATKTGWQQLSQTLTAAASGDQLSFAVYSNSISAGQIFYADDFSLTSPS